jgi:hypothetical protein
MSLFSTGRTNLPFNRAAAWGYAAANLLLWPGLGTALAKRWTGLVLMGVSAAGVVMVLAGFIGLYGRWFTQLEFPGWRDRYMLILLAGLALFVLTWLLSLFSSISIILEGKRNEQSLPPKVYP